MPRVWNKRDPNTPKDAVYVGRPTLLGNPYSHMPPAKKSLAPFHVDTREEAVESFEIWIRLTIAQEHALSQLRDTPTPYTDAVRGLYGKDLVCWCAPQACHAEVLIQLAEELHEGDFNVDI